MAITFKQMMEDQYTSEFKVKKWVDPVTGKTRERKIRPHRVEFDASKLRGEPSQDDDRGDHGMKESFNSTGQGSVKTNNYSWGKMKTVHHGADFSIPLHPEHHEAIAKLQDQQEHKFKTEDGKHWTAKRVGADVHFHGANNGQKTVVSHASMREETEQDLANELHEVLSKDAKAGDWIHDFVHSTNPKFEGKTKKERIKMALGAYYGKQNESSDHDPWHDAQENKKSAEAAKKQGDNFAYHLHMADHHENMAHWSMNRGRHHVANQHQMKADQHHDWANELKENAPVAPVPDRKYIKGTPEWKAHKEKSKPINGHPTNMNKEEVEIIEAKDMGEYSTRHTVTAHVSDNTGTPADGEKRDIIKKSASILAASPKDAESAARRHFADKGYKVHKIEVKASTGKSSLVKMAEDAMTGNSTFTTEALTAKTSAPAAPKLGVNTRPKSTEVKSTTKSEVPFDQPYTTNTGNITDKSGAVHTPMSRARDLARKALQQMQKEGKQYPGLEKEPKKGLPTAVIKKSANSVESDTVEGWDHPHDAVRKEEVQKVNVPAYLRKQRGDKPLELKDLKRKDTISDPENLRKASGVSEDAKISYQDFALMLEYEAKEGRYVHKGTYGGSYSDPEGADDTDDKKPKQQPAEKRGRGRPAGAKSGARKITGTSKLFK